MLGKVPHYTVDTFWMVTSYYWFIKSCGHGFVIENCVHCQKFLHLHIPGLPFLRCCHGACERKQHLWGDMSQRHRIVDYGVNVRYTCAFKQFTMAFFLILDFFPLCFWISNFYVWYKKGSYFIVCFHLFCYTIISFLIHIHKNILFYGEGEDLDEGSVMEYIPQK